MVILYRAALRLLPEAVRETHGAQMTAVFDELLRDARARRGRLGMVRTTLTEFAALMRFAWREHRRLRRRKGPSWELGVGSWELNKGRPRMVSTLLQDLRYATRLLLRTPGFSFVAIATMALAIGANTAIFSVVNGVLFEALPYQDPERIVVLGHYARDGDGDGLGSTTPGNFYDWQARATGFETMAAFSYTERILTASGTAERVIGVLSAGSVFDVLKRAAAEGRTFTASEDGPGAERVVVLSDRLARRLFGEGAAVGRAIGLGGQSFTVVGVMPGDFAFPDYDAEFWIPARFDAQFRTNRDQYFLQAVARLKPGVAVDQARAQLDTVMDAIRRDFPQFTQNATAGVVPMRDVLVDNVRARLLTLMGAVIVVLLIACANLGNLLLARASARRREVALRHALGARPTRLMRQLLTESVLLALAGGAAGLVLGAIMLRGLLALVEDILPLAGAVNLDATVLAFTAATSVAAGVAFGVLPALQLAGGAPSEMVREGTRGSSRGHWVRTTLVASEVALALMLLAGAGLLVRSFANLLDVDPGFRPAQLLTFRIGVPSDIYSKPAQRVAFFEDVLARAARLPGVQAAAMTSYLPVAGRGTGAWFNILDKPLPAHMTPPSVPYRVVTPNYFQTLGIGLVRGRLVDERHRVDGTRAVVISQSVARKYWPSEDPIGKHIYLGAPDNRLFPDAEVVGIVTDVKQSGLDSAANEAVYFSHRMMPSWSTFSFILRSQTDPAALIAAIRAQVREIDPSVPLYRVQTMDEVLVRSMAAQRMSMTLVALFAGVALLLAMIGVFGVLSYTVAQRTKEMGIRLALGASAHNVKMLVLGQGMLPVVAGVGVGLAGAFALTRFMESLLFEVTATDPATFATVALLLSSVAALASYLPARRATLVDPVTVLRNE